MVDTYFKVILKYLFKKNLLDIEPALYSNLKSIFQLRNEIMHKGHLDESSYKKVGINKLDFETCSLMLYKLEKAILMITKLFGEKYSGDNEL
jgi:hypothetical protein